MFSWICLWMSFHLVYSLRCTTNCSKSFLINETFVRPWNCSYMTSNRCAVKILFWYERERYMVTFPEDFSIDSMMFDQSQFLMIETMARTRFFSYEINHLCKDQDDCGQNFAEKIIRERTRRLIDINHVYMDLEKILSRTSKETNDLVCFDSNEAIRQCAIPGMIGSCQIIDDLTKLKLQRRSCQRSTSESASVNIYDTGSYAVMTVKCNRMLCNGPLTIEAVKNVLKHYNIMDINSRLPADSSRLSLKDFLLLMSLFCTFLFK